MKVDKRATKAREKTSCVKGFDLSWWIDMTMFIQLHSN